MVNENTSLLPVAQVTKEKANLQKILRALQKLLNEILENVIFGDSLKTGLDIYLESLQMDIKAAGAKDFRVETISVIGAYLALIGTLIGYALRQKLIKSNDINNKWTYRIYKITQAVGAWGLHAYIMKLFLFSVSEACTATFKRGHLGFCSNNINEPLPLSTFCCVDKENTADLSNPVISLNELAFIGSSIFSMEVMWYALDVFRYEFKKQTLSKRALNILSILTSAASYCVLKFGVSTQLPLLYYTAVPIGVYHLTHFLTSIPMIITSVDEEHDNRTIIINTRDSYKNGILAVLLIGVGGAALLQGGIYTLEMRAFPYAFWRNVMQYTAAAGISFTVAIQAAISNDIKDFSKRLLTYFFPKPLLKKIHCLPDHLAQPNVERPPLSLKLFTYKKIAGTLISSASSYFLADLIFEHIINSIPHYHEPGQIIESTEGQRLRFGFAIAGFLIYANTAYGEHLNIANALTIDWPSFTKLATFTLMSYNLFKAIENEENPHQIISIILSVTIMLTILFGHSAFKHISNYIKSFSNQEENSITLDSNPATNPEQDEQQTVTQNSIEDASENADEHLTIQNVNSSASEKKSLLTSLGNWCCFHKKIKERHPIQPQGVMVNNINTQPPDTHLRNTTPTQVFIK